MPCWTRRCSESVGGRTARLGTWTKLVAGRFGPGAGIGSFPKCKAPTCEISTCWNDGEPERCFTKTGLFDRQEKNRSVRLHDMQEGHTFPDREYDRKNRPCEFRSPNLA